MLCAIGLIIMAVAILALFYEIGYCNGFEDANGGCEKNVKGESDEEKDN